MIEVEGVHKAYGGKTVLGPVDLTIPAGGVTALVGPNGAGKSTLLTIIGRLLDADAGQVRVGGHDVKRTDSKVLARTMSILRQENHFVTRLTVRQLVGFGRFPHSGGRMTLEDHEQVDRALAFLDLTDLGDRFLDQLSGGQRQRAYVAMVLAQDTEYLLLDEPLNNLDMQHAVSMMRQLRRAADDLGKTVVIVIHDINFASAYADRIVALKGGLVVQEGPAREIMTTEILSEVFNTNIVILDGQDYPLAVYYR